MIKRHGATHSINSSSTRRPTADRGAHRDQDRRFRAVRCYQGSQQRQYVECAWSPFLRDPAVSPPPPSEQAIVPPEPELYALRARVCATKAPQRGTPGGRGSSEKGRERGWGLRLGRLRRIRRSLLAARDRDVLSVGSAAESFHFLSHQFSGPRPSACRLYLLLLSAAGCLSDPGRLLEWKAKKRREKSRRRGETWGSALLACSAAALAPSPNTLTVAIHT
ncbi:hypothetical protein DL771_002834 [Monosporascus sp. 5C6A]|nr:hypothetical protein DL771_002834 [Monosporascus sp. 5C6A]